MPLLLAIDQGTSATKVVIFRDDGTVAASAAVEVACTCPRPGFVEQDPEALSRSVIEAVRRCIAALTDRGGAAADIVSCGISNQRETFLLWDEKGVPLGNAVSWQCERSAAACARLRGGELAGEVTSRTGLLLVPYFSGTKLLWLMENDPAIRAAARAGHVRFGTIDTWLLWRLTGGSAHATDFTNASRTLLFNVDDLAWDPRLCEAWKAADLVLPSCRPSVHPFGETDFEGTLPRRVRIDAMIGDSHAAAFGERCFSPGMVKATLGTGSSLLMDVGERRLPARNGNVSTINWSTATTVHFALEGIIVSCGATIAWMRAQLGLLGDSAEAEALAASVADNGGVYLVPAFSGLGSPRWKSSVRASIVGLTFASTRAHLVRAALESIPFQVAEVLSCMAEAGATRPAELRADGGLSANRFVMQLLADTAGLPVTSFGLPEVSALGAAMLAGLGAGIYGSLDALPPLPRAPRRYEPGPGAEAAHRELDAWLHHVARTT